MRLKTRVIAVLALLTCVAGNSPAQDLTVPLGLALTPLTGFNTWNKFGCDVSEQLVREKAPGTGNRALATSPR